MSLREYLAEVNKTPQARQLERTLDNVDIAVDNLWTLLRPMGDLTTDVKAYKDNVEFMKYHRHRLEQFTKLAKILADEWEDYRMELGLELEGEED